MKTPKIHLSAAETELMKNAEVILTKNSILERIRSLLQEVERRQLRFSENSTDAAFAVSPKISRGENYLGLPYLVLDYPRLSSGDGIFFIRSFFWWGKFFSSTLQLSGVYADRYRPEISASYHLLTDHYISMDSDPWVHHLEAPQYKKVAELTEDGFRKRCGEADPLKLAVVLSLDEWAVAEERLYERWKDLLRLCGLVA